MIAESGWFAARPSNTENIYKIYAESFRGQDHLRRIAEEAQAIVHDAIENVENAPAPLLSAQVPSMSGSTLIVAINALMLKRTKLAGIHQPGKTATPEIPAVTTTPESGKTPSNTAPPQPDKAGV